VRPDRTRSSRRRLANSRRRSVGLGSANSGSFLEYKFDQATTLLSRPISKQQMSIDIGCLTTVADRETLSSVKDDCQGPRPTLAAVFQNVIQAPGGSRETRASLNRASSQTKPASKAEEGTTPKQKTVGPGVAAPGPNLHTTEVY
jgi:hypothetical protein